MEKQGEIDEQNEKKNTEQEKGISGILKQKKNTAEQ